MTKVYILKYGKLKLDSNIILARDTYLTTENESYIKPKWLTIPVIGALVMTEGHNVLFDLGCMPNAMEENGWPKVMRISTPFYPEPDENPVSQLAKIGLTPKDIDTVIVSHTHNDHFGNIADFAHAKVYLPREDWVTGLITLHSSTDPSTYGSYIPQMFNVRIREVHTVGIGEDFELYPGIEILTLPGHTLGLLGMAVHLKNSGTLLFPSDAVYSKANLGPPVHMSGSAADTVRMRESFEKVRKLALQYCAKIVFPHDAAELSTYRTIPEYYD